jgi:hypothetical protein
MKRWVLVITGVLLAAAAVTAQDRLAVTDKAPKQDGVISDGEYTLRIALTGGALYLSRTASGLYAAVQRTGTGWVAVGLGSLKMDGAKIYMGLVKDGKGALSVQSGSGHGHSEAAGSSITAYLVKEDKNGTVMELAFEPKGLIAEGQRTLSLIVALGPGPSISAYHVFRKAVEVGL